MPVLRSQTRPAPTGYDSTNDARLLDPSRASLLRNFVADRAGVLRGDIARSNVWEGLPGTPDGLVYYPASADTSDRLLASVGGQLYVGVPTSTDRPPKWVFSSIPYGNGFTVGKPLRAALYGDELIIVQDGGLTPKRFDGTNLYQLGMSPPSAPQAFPGTPSGGASANTAGTRTYKVTFRDASARESDLSSGTSINYTTHTGKSGYITLFNTWSGIDPQVVEACIYTNVAAGALWYKIATLQRSENEVTFEDNLSNSSVQTGSVAAALGRYANPNSASCVAVWKRMVALNDTTQQGTLQISGVGSPTLFANPTDTAGVDGTRFVIPGAGVGNAIVQLIPFGSLLFVYLEHGMGQMWGDTSADMKYREVHIRGGVSPGSIVRTDNYVMHLEDDGVYRIGGDFTLNKVSQEIETDIGRHTRAERLAAQGTFLKNRYILAIGDTIYKFDLTVGGWSQVKYAD